MNKMRRLIVATTCLALSSLIISACGKEQADNKSKKIEVAKEVAVLPNHSLEVELLNPNHDSIEVEPYTSDVANVTVLNETQISINGLQEGESTLGVSVGKYHYSIDVECLDLQFTMDTNYVQKGTTQQITINKNVSPTYAIDNTDIAEIQNNTIHAKEEGVFTLSATYKDIVIEKTFDTYIRKASIDVFNRDNPFIHYLGRNFHANKKVRMDNEGSGFEVYFKGTYLKATIAAKAASYYGKTRVSVLVDDETDTTKRVVELSKGSRESNYTLVENLSNDYHKVTVLKRTENLATTMTLSSLSTNGKFHPVNAPDRLRMEVYGDSITAGYGNLRGALDDQTSSLYQSGLQTYATYTASALGAEINVQARSGIGIYTANNDIGEGNHIKDHFNKVNYDGKIEWNFSNYIPDVVLINAGTNDYWDASHFVENTFINYYKQLVHSLAEAYGENVKFILLSGLMEQEVNAFVLKIKNQLVNEITNPIYTYQFRKCAAGHPLAEEHALASDELVAFMQANHLDVIPNREHQEKVIPEISSGEVTTTVNIELQDMIKAGSKLYVNYGSEKIELTKQTTFKYSFEITAEEQDLSVYFTIDDNPEYQSKNYIVHIRNNYQDKLVLDTFLNSPELEDDQSQFGWIMTDHLFNGSFTATDESNLTAVNENWLAGLIVRDSEQGDDYKLSVNIKSSATITDFSNTYIGVVPYYLDESNFVVAYLQWNNANKIRGIGCTGLIDGQDIGWNDFSTISDFAVDLTTGVDFEIARNGTLLTITVNSITESKNIAGMSGTSEKVGVWFYHSGCSIIYSNFSEVHHERVISKDWVFTPHLNEGTMTPNSDTSVTLYNTNNWMAGFAVQESAFSDNYTISANMLCAKDNFVESEDVSLGVVPYYVNENNFVVVYLQWTSAGVLKSMGCTGLINGNNIGWNDCWTFANVTTSLTTNQAIEVTRRNKTLTIKFNNVTGSVTINALDGLSTAYLGFYSNKTTTTFSNVSHVAA